MFSYKYTRYNSEPQLVGVGRKNRAVCSGLNCTCCHCQIEEQRGGPEDEIRVMWLRQAEDHLQGARPHQAVVEMFAAAEEPQGLGQEAQHDVVSARGEREERLDQGVIGGLKEGL